jgi:hypothetical protein
VYLSQAVTRQTRLQLVPAPPDPNRAPTQPNRHRPVGVDPLLPPPLPVRRRRRHCSRRNAAGMQPSPAAMQQECSRRVGLQPSPLPPLARRRRRRLCRKFGVRIGPRPAPAHPGPGRSRRIGPALLALTRCCHGRCRNGVDGVGVDGVGADCWYGRATQACGDEDWSRMDGAHTIKKDSC